jgi:hypothetical protein
MDRGVRSAARLALVSALILVCLSGAAAFSVRIAVDFPKLGEVAYPDSYVLYDADHYRQSGTFYRDAAAPPFPSGIYSPAVYALLALPGRVSDAANPFLGPRLLMLLAFAGCVALTVNLASTLSRVRGAAVWSLLLAASISTMPAWVLQLRGDFPGALFGLLAMRLLLARGPAAMLMAGVAAGVSFQFKITFVAALSAGALWLLARRRFRDFAWFVAAGVVCAVGPLLYVASREPELWSRLFHAYPIVRNLPGAAHLLMEVLREPVFLLALVALPFLLRRGRSRWWLLALYGAISLAVGATANLQAGGNSNYFFEGLLGLTPIAAIGVLRVAGRRQHLQPAASLLAAGLLVSAVALPGLAATALTARHGLSAAGRSAERRPVEMLQNALPGHHVLATVPGVAFLTDEPIMIEPYLLAYGQRAGTFDTQPIRERIQRREFEAVVTDAALDYYRGVPRVPPDVWEAIAVAYRPFCSPGPRWVVHVPRDQSGGGALGAKLEALGCAPLSR